MKKEAICRMCTQSIGLQEVALSILSVLFRQNWNYNHLKYLSVLFSCCLCLQEEIPPVSILQYAGLTEDLAGQPLCFLPYRSDLRDYCSLHHKQAQSRDFHFHTHLVNMMKREEQYLWLMPIMSSDP